MDSRFFTFVWRYSKRDQLIILALTIASFPLVYISLEIPKIIINEAISGTDFPKEFLGLELEQVPYLMMLCFAFLFLVVAINAIKWVMNVQIGMTGERMLRRMRYMLFERVMRFRIQRFRSTKAGEVIQSILGEIEPLGGFFGEVIATPCFQGGLLVVYVTFIFMQDVVLGFAAVSLYPIQAFIIPKLQAKIVRLNKQRAANTRVLADTIGEAVNVIPEIHTNDTARWHMAQVAGRLYQNTVIRLQLFKRKFTIKFVNNFMNQLTPFFFYSAGGYLVIRGDLDFGSLVAVLAAYKDVAAPWKAVLNYVQRWTDFNSRYIFVVENFSGADVMSDSRVYADETAEPLSGTLEFREVEGGPGTGGLQLARLDIAPGQMAGVAGGSSGGREALLRFASGLGVPASGRITMGGRALADCSMPQIGAAIAYVGAEPGIVSGTLRENLLYGLFRQSPDLADADGAEIAEMLREARLTGNATADPHGDWVDYAAAGFDGPEALEDRLMALIDMTGLSPEVYSGALNARIDPARAVEWTGPIMEARARLRGDGADLSDMVEDWDPEGFNSNATILENLLFGLPNTARTTFADYLDDPGVIALIDEIGARPEMLAIGEAIAREFSELVDAVEGESSVLDSFQGYDRADILAAHEAVIAMGGTVKAAAVAAREALFIKLAAVFVQVRDRLDVLDEDRIARLLEYRAKARALIAERDDFVTFDEDRFMPGRSISGNIVHGKRRFDRRATWRRLDALMEQAIDEAGLRRDLIRLGLDRHLGSGSGISSATKRRIGLVRALMKRPALMVLDGIAGNNTATDAALRAAIREAVPEATILYAVAEDGAEAGADIVIRIGEDGAARCEEPESKAQP